MELTQEGIRAALRSIKYPGFSRDIVSFGIVKNIEIDGSKVAVSLLLPKPDEALEREITDSVRKLLADTEGVEEVNISVSARQPKTFATKEPPRERKPAIKYHVAVASGKGGVGKSTVAVNLAIAISRLRKNVGLMDADIYGPSIPIMLGVRERPVATPEQKIIPIERGGLKLMSIGFLINEEDAVIWRGPMVHSAIKQFIEDVEWAGTDYLVIDLPPGTGDAHLSLIQNVPLSGGVIVTTPQEVALIDVKRGIQMFRRLNVPVLGVVENMSHLVTPSGETLDIFGRGGGKKMADKLGVPFLGEIPIDPEIRKGGDTGEPIMEAHPESPAGRAFMEIAEKILSMIEKG
jgi:ATP-binding protein involved in chromosome partitioning